MKEEVLENSSSFAAMGIRPFRFNLGKSATFTENSREIYISFIIVCYNIYTERKRETNTYGYQRKNYQKNCNLF